MKTVKFCYNVSTEKGIKPHDIHAEMIITLGDNFPALSTVQIWAAECRSERVTLKMTKVLAILQLQTPRKTLIMFTRNNDRFVKNIGNEEFDVACKKMESMLLLEIRAVS